MEYRAENHQLRTVKVPRREQTQRSQDRGDHANSSESCLTLGRGFSVNTKGCEYDIRSLPTDLNSSSTAYYRAKNTSELYPPPGLPANNLLDVALDQLFGTCGPFPQLTDVTRNQSHDGSIFESASQPMLRSATSLTAPTLMAMPASTNAQNGYFTEDNSHAAPPMRKCVTESRLIPRLGCTNGFLSPGTSLYDSDQGLQWESSEQVCSRGYFKRKSEAQSPTPKVDGSNILSSSSCRPKRPRQQIPPSNPSRRSILGRHIFKHAIRNSEVSPQIQGPPRTTHPASALQPLAEETDDYYDSWSTKLENPCTDFEYSTGLSNLTPSPPEMNTVSSSFLLDGFPIVTPDPFQNCDDWDITTASNNFDLNNLLSDEFASSMETNSQEDTNAQYLNDFAYHAPIHNLSIPEPRGQSRRKSDPPPFSHNVAIRSTPMNKSLSAPAPTTNLPFFPSNSQLVPLSHAQPLAGAFGPNFSAVALRPSPRGKRQGPLEEDKRVAARKTRQCRTMCIGCKMSKVSCVIPDGSDTCLKCMRIPQNSRHPFVCTKAYFLEIISSGTTNYISQCSINHVRRDLIHRKRLDLPAVLDFRDLLPQIESLSRAYDIRVSQGQGSLYVLDLAACHIYLSDLHVCLSVKQHAFRGFIDSQLGKSDGWASCIKDGEALKDLLEVLVIWNNMPSRVTYALISKSDGLERLLDPDNRDDEQTLFTAAQLSRIINRKLELAAYQHLQGLLNTNAPVTTPLLIQLAHLLLTLRWRISWWQLLGSGSVPTLSEQREKDSFAARVQALCRILYFYYCSMRRRLPSYTDITALQGKWSNYADTQRGIWEDFPQTESVEGFKEWMAVGKQMISEAKVVEQLRTVGLA
ncbi:hypothetical protein G7046_g54 [Stylonectria norvegica]|nr:hypothetical protein G7046_g54 [Stylonectria norvegica]